MPSLASSVKEGLLAALTRSLRSRRQGAKYNKSYERNTRGTLRHRVRMVEIAISAARSQLGDLVRRAAHGRETIALTDHGHVAALLVSPHVIEDLEDALVFADYQRRKAEGGLEEGIPMAEVRRRLGLEQQ